MAKTKLKTVNRKTTISRDAISRAFAGVRAAKGKNRTSAAESALSQQTNTKKKQR